MPDVTLLDALRMAGEHFAAGRLAEAESICRQILAHQPDQPDTLHLLGIMAQQVQNHEVALMLASRAVSLAPGIAEFQNTLGNALKAMGHPDDAAAAFRRALELRPQLAEAHNNLACIHFQQRRFDQAANEFRAATALKPTLAEPHMNLGDALQELGEYESAVAEYRAAIQLGPNLHKACNNLATTLNLLRRFDHAAQAANMALRLKPDYPQAHNNLGTALLELGQSQQAAASFERAIQFKPDYAEVFNNLANAFRRFAPLDQAISAYQTSIRLNPNLAEPHNNLASTFKDAGDLDQAIACHRRAVQLKPNDSLIHSNLIYTLHFHSGSDHRSIAEEHARWAQQHAEPLRHLIQPHSNKRDPDRPLRIGYVSPDFYAHAECFFVLPLLAAHDRNQFQVHCYSSVRRPDAITTRIQNSADVWHEVLQLSDAALADRIRADQIDILIDLTMHMQDNRLLTFARKAAPVQVTWLAYPGSTGLKTIDYRLTDAFLDPPDSDTSWSAEKPIRLPDCWCCYQPIIAEVPVSDLPALSTGHVTFGSLNNFCKINDRVIDLWGRLMAATSGSWLLLLSPPGNHRQKFLDSMHRHGISADRIEFFDRLPQRDYLSLYHRIDIALDPFPYNGITTTCDAFWMGVPVLTMIGPTPAARAGWGLLQTIGLPELATRSPNEFLKLAADLTSDLPRLASLRSTLRQRIESSPLMDAPRFARNVEAAYREMWRRFVR